MGLDFARIERFARRGPGLWSSCPGSLSMPWPPEGMSSTWASLHWLPTSAFTLPWHVSDVCIQGPRLPICLLLILTCLDTLGRRPSGRPAGTLSNNNQNGINQTNRKQPLRTVNSYTTLPKNTCSSVVGKTNLSHDNFVPEFQHFDIQSTCNRTDNDVKHSVENIQ